MTETKKIIVKSEKRNRHRDISRLIREENESSPDSEVVSHDDIVYSTSYTQYRSNGPGYAPTTPTINRVPSGTYTVSYVNEQLTLVPFQIKMDDIINLSDTKSDSIISEIKQFWGDDVKTRFKKHGIVHKRGYLLWGPPGSGKTATIQFVMKDFVKSGGIAIMGNVRPEMLSDMLGRVRLIEPNRNILVVFEDIDEIIENHGEAEILSVLDGEKQINGVVFMATTNYPENLDNRVKNRPSRFDRVEKIDAPSQAARKEFITYKLSDYATSEEIENWVSLTKDFSIAHIKELIINVMCLGNSLEDQVSRLKNMGKLVSSSDAKKPFGFGGGDSND
jgi:hypothetical protein